MPKKLKELDETLTASETRTPGSMFIDPNLDRFDLRMQELISSVGSVAEIARRCGLSEAVVRSWRDGNSDPSRQRLISLWKGTGASIDWLVAGVGPMFDSSKTAAQSDSQAVRLEELTIAIQLVDEALEGKTLETPKRAELVALVYEGLIDGLPEAKVLRWARAASK